MRSLFPARNSAPSYAPPTAPSSTHEALSLTARYVPGESAAAVPATLPVLPPARRDDKRRAASPTHNGILPESCPPPPQPAAFHARGSLPAEVRCLPPSANCVITHRSSGSAPAVRVLAASAPRR